MGKTEHLALIIGTFLLLNMIENTINANLPPTIQVILIITLYFYALRNNKIG